MCCSLPNKDAAETEPQTKWYAHTADQETLVCFRKVVLLRKNILPAVSTPCRQLCKVHHDKQGGQGFQVIEARGPAPPHALRL